MNDHNEIAPASLYGPPQRKPDCGGELAEAVRAAEERGAAVTRSAGKEGE